MKIFSTQLTGHFNRIVEQEELSIEDSARLLAQALVGEGKIYIYGFQELHGIVLEAVNSSEPLIRSEALFNQNGEMKELTAADRVLLFTYRSTDEEAIKLAQELSSKGIQTVGISAVMKGEEAGLNNITDLHIDSKLRQPLIPGEDGERYGFPALMTSLYVYYNLTFILKEILDEFEDDEL